MIELLHGRWRGCNVAVAIAGRQVLDLYIERQDRPNLVGGIARGKVTQVRSGSLQAFVTLPDGTLGFLHSKQPLKTGQELPLQVSAYPTGNKAWPLSTELKLQHSALIHIINGRSVSASARLPPAKAASFKQMLKEAKLPGGWIIRHHAQNLKPAELRAIADVLQQQTPDLNSTAVWLHPAPAVLDRAQLDHPDASARLLDDATLDDWLAPLLTQCIEFGQGSSITISPTPALTAIDVDAGSNGNAAAVNRDATRQIAAALRSRSLAGQFVIDFCRDGDKAGLVKNLAAALAADPLGTTLYGMTRLGLCELTRPRYAPNLWEAVDGH